MFLVDTSIWIGYLRGARTRPVAWFGEILERDYPFGLTSVIYQEVLQGADSEADFERLAEYLGTQRFYEPQDGAASFAEAARLYFRCRRAGVTVRSTIDCLIARVAIEHQLFLVHDDRDFERMASVVPGLLLYSGGLGGPPPTEIREGSAAFRSA